VEVIRGRGGGQKTLPLSGKATELWGCLGAGGGGWRKTAIYGTFKGEEKRKKKEKNRGRWRGGGNGEKPLFMGLLRGRRGGRRRKK